MLSLYRETLGFPLVVPGAADHHAVLGHPGDELEHPLRVQRVLQLRPGRVRRRRRVHDGGALRPARGELLPDGRDRRRSCARCSRSGWASSRSGCGRCGARSSPCSPWPCRSSSPRWPGSTTRSTAARASRSGIPPFPPGSACFQDFLYLASLSSPGSRWRWRSSWRARDPAGRWRPSGTPRTSPRRWASRPSGTSCWRSWPARCIGGVGGSLFALQIGFVTVESVFGLTVPLFVIVMSVLGGRTHWLGPLIGAVADRAAAGPAHRPRSRPAGRSSSWAPCSSCWSWWRPTGSTCGCGPGRAGALIAVRRGHRGAVGCRSTSRSTRSWSGCSPATAVALWPSRRRARRSSRRAPTGSRGTVRTGASCRPTVDDDAVDGAGRVPEPHPAFRRRARAGGPLAGRSGRASSSASSGRTAPARPPWSTCSPGSLRPTSGRIRVAGRDITGCRRTGSPTPGVARTYQIPQPFASMTVRDNVAMAVMFGRVPRQLAHARARRRRAPGTWSASATWPTPTRPRSTCTSGSCWRWPARSRPRRRCCCSTRPWPG